MAHPLETAIREAYAAFGRGDVDGYLQPCTADFTFHVPGRAGISGIYVGQLGLRELAGKAMEITGGTFPEEVEDVLANDVHAVVLARHRFTHSNAPKTTEPRTYMRSATGSGPAVLSSRAIQPSSMKRWGSQQG